MFNKNKIQRVKFVARMFKRLIEIDYDNPVVACLQFNNMEKQYAIALSEGIINKEDYDSLIKAVEDTKARILKG